MLQKMGWKPGEGLGKNKEGAIEPLLLDIKVDKKGFHAQEELPASKHAVPMVKELPGGRKGRIAGKKAKAAAAAAAAVSVEPTDAIGKHPVSALVELCCKRKWKAPEFEIVIDTGPDHKKTFLMQVQVNGVVYKPPTAACTKKLAKANAAASCLQALGLIPKDTTTSALSIGGFC